MVNGPSQLLGSLLPDWVCKLIITKEQKRSHDVAFNQKCGQETIYGTAWKGTETARLVIEALRAGYRALDTAAQPRHYREDLVGEGVRRAVAEGVVSRDQLHIQTKFSPASLQDLQSVPFNLGSPIKDQVRKSVELSLKHFKTNPQVGSYLDVVLLHSFLPSGEETLQAWQALEEFVPTHVKAIGVSNITVEQLEVLWRFAVVKPSIVQNRFYRRNGYDGALRRFCKSHGIKYQAYWVLKKNADLLVSHPVCELSRLAGLSREASLFFLLADLEIAVLDGTTQIVRMHANQEDLEWARKWSRQSTTKKNWTSLQHAFNSILE